MTSSRVQACIFVALLAACSRPNAASEGGATSENGEANTGCPAREAAFARVRGVSAELESLDYWLALNDPAALDKPLLGPNALARHDAALKVQDDTKPRIVDMTRTPTKQEVVRTLEERLSAVRERFESGDYQVESTQVLEQLAMRPQAFVLTPSMHVALSAIDLRCAPFEARIESTQNNPRFDRNSCSQARAQAPIEILGRVPGYLRLARTRYSVGFIKDDAPLSPPIPEELSARYLKGEEREVLSAHEHNGQSIPAATFLPSAGGEKVWLASSEGFDAVTFPEGKLRATRRALTRRAFLTEAFRFIGDRYGWGDEGGGRDCSRLVLDVLQSFGLHLPRNSAAQSTSGLYTLDVPPEASGPDRQGLLDAAHARGIVLVHFPGHIFIYLGRDRDGVPRALHALAEYVVPCPSGGETLMELERVSVTDLTLGQGSSRGAFLERMTRITVLGDPPGYALMALARFRPALEPALGQKRRCTSGARAFLTHSPMRPTAGEPLRIVAAAERDVRPASLFLVNPKGQVVTPSVDHLGVGPFGQLGEITPSVPGRWTALLADGAQIVACDRFGVGRPKPKQTPTPEADEPVAEERPAWTTKRAFSPAYENLFAVFVEHLFSHDLSDMRTWAGLDQLLSDPSRNLLFNHLGLDEDRQLALKPDCADLPYFLRSYFAWKHGLPFALRRCTRGHANKPPRCEAPISNEKATRESDPVRAFDRFVRRTVGWGVHSATVRTLPGDEASDLYPVALTRENLKPGTVFADPYGHVIVVAKWVPQGISGAGMLLGADAQPDAAVGRRRFWEGNFLFTPDTRDVGAGFKAFRPVVRDDESGQLTQLDNATLKNAKGFPRYDTEQYAGDRKAFYRNVDALIYPRPVEAESRMRQIVDALEEQLVRRVDAVDMGEGYVREHEGVMEMPEGFAIFETQGAWEDFATPSRDMRLLIAMDVVRDFADAVANEPERFGLPASTKREAVQAQLDRRLAARSFAYTQSDGAKRTLTLREAMHRIGDFELAYNPNDCVEVRWGAPAGSDELSTCTRHAPEEQRARMREYQAWFSTRKRPARP